MGFTARIKLVRPEYSTDIISEAARQEFSKRWQGEPVRSVSITAGKSVSQGQEQLELFFAGEEKNHAIDRVVDDLRKRFGKKMIFYAGAMAGGTFLERAGRIMWADIKEKVNDVKRAKPWYCLVRGGRSTTRNDATVNSKTCRITSSEVPFANFLLTHRSYFCKIDLVQYRCSYIF